jgi:hypothetical protein
METFAQTVSCTDKPCLMHIHTHSLTHKPLSYNKLRSVTSSCLTNLRDTKPTAKPVGRSSTFVSIRLRHPSTGVREGANDDTTCRPGVCKRATIVSTVLAAAGKERQEAAVHVSQVAATPCSHPQLTDDRQIPAGRSSSRHTGRPVCQPPLWRGWRSTATSERSGKWALSSFQPLLANEPRWQTRQN